MAEMALFCLVVGLMLIVGAAIAVSAVAVAVMLVRLALESDER